MSMHDTDISDVELGYLDAALWSSTHTDGEPLDVMGVEAIHPDTRKAMLADMAILTGATVVSEEIGLKLDGVTLDLLGPGGERRRVGGGGRRQLGLDGAVDGPVGEGQAGRVPCRPFRQLRQRPRQQVAD